jgi:putative transposase
MASPVVDQQLVAELVARAVGQGVSVTGEGGLLQQLTKLVPEASLEGQMDARLGYAKHDPAGRDGGNSRNGERSKTVLTQVGPVEIAVPRDLDASFQPQMVRKRQRRLDGIDSDRVVVVRQRVDHRRGSLRASGRGVRRHRVEGDHFEDHRQGDGLDGRVAVASAGPGRCTRCCSSTPPWSRYATGRWPPPDLHRDRRHARRRKGCAGLVACSALRWVSSHSGK